MLSLAATSTVPAAAISTAIRAASIAVGAVTGGCASAVDRPRTSIAGLRRTRLALIGAGTVDHDEQEHQRPGSDYE